MAVRLKTLLVMLIFGLSVITFSASAGDSWWQKGLDIFSSDSDADKDGTATASTGEIGDAFKQALHIAAENVVKQLGGVDGFNADPEIHIPLPKKLKKVKKLLGKVGMSGFVEDLEVKLNRAAEAATPKAKKLFWAAIQDMKFDDIKAIYTGPDDSATLYFRNKMSASLSAEMRPVIEQSLAEVGAVQTYDSVMGKYEDLPFVPAIKTDLTDYVLKRGMDGIFFYMAKQEAAIRKDPLKQTSALLKKVFGAL